MTFPILRMCDSIYVLTCLLLDHVCLMLGLQTDARKHIIGENIGWDSIVARLARLSVACAPLDDYFISNSIIHLKCRSSSGSKRPTSNHAPGTCTEQIPTRACSHILYRRRPWLEVELCISHGLCKSDQSHTSIWSVVHATRRKMPRLLGRGHRPCRRRSRIARVDRGSECARGRPAPAAYVVDLSLSL
jgi:hypothetical protein